jgi:hypothetical protein
MIGGYDLIYKSTVSPESARDIMALIVKSVWPSFIVEEMEDKKEWPDCFFYKDEASKKLWDELGAVPQTENTMIYFLAGSNEITLVIGSKTHPDMINIIKNVESFKIMWQTVFSNPFSIGDSDCK